MNIKTISILSFTVILAACGGPVSTVKESPLSIDETLTVDQAFSNRNVCKNVSWEEFEDDRGRVVVNYSCEIKIGSYFDEKLEKNAESTKEAIQQEKASQEKEIAYERKMIETRQSSLDVLENLSQTEIDKWEVERGTYKNPKIEGCRFYDIVSYNGPFHERCQQYLHAKIKSSLKSIKSAEEFSVGYAERFNASLEERRQQKVESLFEVFQWSFKDVDGEDVPQLIFSGYTVLMANGEEKSIGYRSSSRALKTLYANEVTNVVEFATVNRIYDLL